MAGLCEGGNEPPGSLKAKSDIQLFQNHGRLCKVLNQHSYADTTKTLGCSMINEKYPGVGSVEVESFLATEVTRH
ncbi:hypothetical protein ANN_15669 [Periplaneta americana]|uniref:Uncharacterized protein n=1 Tax=Periplaneta americana TaxID=6978 RepID=A0ABQ8SIX7_PERAM|nr:hypothetical protein ANN_15669 [Periplaneta americana]